MSSIGLELLTSDSGVAFPFDDDAAVPEEVARCLSDCSVMVDHPVVADGAFVCEFVSWRSDDGGLHMTVGVRVEGEPGDIPALYALGPIDESSGPYCVLSSDGLAGRAVFVVDVENAARACPAHFSDVSWRLSDSCLQPEAGRLTSLSILNSEDGEFPSVTVSGIRGDVSLVPGHNMEVVSTGDGLARLSAVPGAGLGRIPCECDESDEAGSTGNVRPDQSGNVVIYTDGGCLAATLDGDATIGIDGRCTPCCTTEMYVEAAKRLSVRNGMLVDSSNSVMDTFRMYSDMVSRASSPCGLITPDNAFFVDMVLQPPTKRRTFGMWKETISNSSRGSMDRCVGQVFMANQSLVSVTVSLARLDVFLSDLWCDTAWGERCPMDVDRDYSTFRVVPFGSSMNIPEPGDPEYPSGIDNGTSLAHFINRPTSLTLAPGCGVAIMFSMSRWSNDKTRLMSISGATSFHARFTCSIGWPGDGCSVPGSRTKSVEKTVPWAMTPKDRATASISYSSEGV